MDSIYVSYGWIGGLTAIIAAKWAMELGFGQVRQLLWAIAAFVLPPLVLLALYVRLLRQRARDRRRVGNAHCRPSLGGGPARIAAQNPARGTV